MFFIPFRNFSSLLFLVFPSRFSSLPFIFCNFLRLSTSLVCLRRFSLFLPICLACLTNFPPFSFLYFSCFSLTSLLFRTAFYFSFSLYFPRLSVSISLLIAVRGQRYLKPFTAPAAVSLGDSRLYTGLMGGIRSTVVLRARATKHHLNAGTVSRCGNFSRAFNSELIRVMKHTRCFKLTR